MNGWHSCNAVATHVGYKKVNKQVEVKFRMFEDQRTEKQGNKEQLKSCKTREVTYTSRYTSGNLIN